MSGRRARRLLVQGAIQPGPQPPSCAIAGQHVGLTAIPPPLFAWARLRLALAPLARCPPLLVPYDVAPGVEFQAGHGGEGQLVFVSGGDRFATAAAGHMRRGSDPELRRRRPRELLVLQQLPYALPHQLVDRDGPHSDALERVTPRVPHQHEAVQRGLG